MDLVLKEKVGKWSKIAKERGSQDPPVLEGRRIGRTQRETSQSPWHRRNEIADHEYIVPVMVVGRGNICPSSAG